MRLALDDLELFLSVCDSGGLQAAAAATGVSAPTLSRKMTALEHDAGQRLFLRGKQGYSLTPEGRALLREAEALRGVRARLANFADLAAPPRVRITAGSFTTRFLARNISKVWQPCDDWVPEFIACNAKMDIARREVDIGVRSQQPDQSWLAGRRCATITYAVFARDPSIEGFIALSTDAPSTPASRWVRANHGDKIVTTYNEGMVGLELARAGLGRMVLPVFAGSAEEDLVQVSETIDEISHDEWLVCHQDTRHETHIRRALDALGALLTRSRPG